MAYEAAREVLKLSASVLYTAWSILNSIRCGGLPENYDDYHEQIEMLTLVAAGFLGYLIEWSEGEIEDAQLYSMLQHKEEFATLAMLAGRAGFEHLLESELDESQGERTQSAQEANNN